MKSVLFLLFALVCLPDAAHSLDIYKNGNSLITGVWNVNGTVSETTASQPYEGGQHYQFPYASVNTWAGYGLNMDNWGSGSPVNFSGFTHLRIAYRGLSAGHSLSIKLRQGTSVFGPEITVGGATSTYTVVNLSLLGLAGSSGINLSQISEIDVSVTTQNGNTGTVYIDAIELYNSTPLPTSTAWDEANSMQMGLNLANFLEAYWLLPFNAYPDATRFVRSDLAFFKNAGYKTIRMPVIFEKLANANAPYTLNTNQTAFALVDSVIAWANAFNMNLIIDNHHGYEVTDANYQSEIPRKCAIWRQLAQRYGGLPANRFFFELYNEPTNSISNTNLRAMMQAIIDTVRVYDSNQTLIIGGNGWNSASGLTSSEPYYDANVIYTFHNYDPYFFTHQGFSWTGLPTGVTFPQGSDLSDLANTFQSVKDWSDFYDVPVFLGEFGAGSWADATSRCNWIEAMTDNIYLQNFPHAYWSPKHMPDDFGFFTSTPPSASNVVPCFADALNLNLTPASVDFISAYTRCDDRQNELRWSAFTPDAGLKFEIQHSTDGFNWSTAGWLEARAGQQDYAFNDQPGDWRHYRLACHNLSGKVEYSPLLTAACGENNTLQIFPNPTAGNAYLSLESAYSQDAILTVYDRQGRLIQQQQQGLHVGENLLPVSLEGMSDGLYWIAVLAENGVLLGQGKVLKGMR